MTTEEIKIRVLVPAAGMRLANGETVAEGKVYLAPQDAPENWREVTVEEAARIEAELAAKVEREAAEAENAETTP